MDTKWCPRCKERRPISTFYVNRGRSDGLSPLCVMHSRQAASESRRIKRRAFIEAMGGRCERCGFDDHRALQVDHVNGDGRVERADKRGGTATFYAEVLAHRERYMLLCANCNQIKKCEQDETVGDRVYARETPSQRLRGIGRGNNPIAKAKIRALLTPEHQAAAGRAKKGKPNPKVAEARRGTKLIDGHWVRPDS